MTASAHRPQHAVLALALVAALAGTRAPSQEPAAASPSLAEAVAALRNVQRDLPPEEVEAASRRLDEAWQVILAAKDDGANALLAELARLAAKSERDDYFALGASALLWRIGGFERAADIAKIWRGADLAANYHYVFSVASDAARQNDLRALPLLEVLLRDHEMASMLPPDDEVRWPATLHLCWGSLGRAALPPLEHQLNTSTDDDVLTSVVELLGIAGDVSALPRIRIIAREGGPRSRRNATQTLGRFGHPDDFEFLCTGLDSDDHDVAWNHAWALYEFGDRRAVPALGRLAASRDERLRTEVLAALGHLGSVEAFAILGERLAARDSAVPSAFEKEVMPGLRAVGVKWREYAAMTRAEQEGVLARVHATQLEKFETRATDDDLTRAGFEQAMAEWIERGTLDGGEFAWVEIRHLLHIATPADVPLLLDVRGASLRRMSHAGLEAARSLDDVVQRLVRSTYRRDPGICNAVEPPPAKTAK